MGIPYSREINAAFDEVTPLVAAGFKVLQTTKNISILLAVIQVLTVFALGLILLVLIGILLSVNPDLEVERKAFVTPIARWLVNSLPSLLWTMSHAFAVLFCFVVIALALNLSRRKKSHDELPAPEDAGDTSEEASK